MRIKNIWIWLSVPLFAGCFASLPPPPNREKIRASDGKWVEQRVERNLSRRPMEVYYVYRDSTGNYVRHGTDTHYYLEGQLKMEETIEKSKTERLHYEKLLYQLLSYSSRLP